MRKIGCEYHPVGTGRCVEIGANDGNQWKQAVCRHWSAALHPLPENQGGYQLLRRDGQRILCLRCDRAGEYQDGDILGNLPVEIKIADKSLCFIK